MIVDQVLDSRFCVAPPTRLRKPRKSSGI
ncbi:hypothetical protein RS9916_34762 [Synechococcus sp. RS9916]|nr:hypothetical protein RS9916_34762 [Synechococcus sp. RS9916]